MKNFTKLMTTQVNKMMTKTAKNKVLQSITAGIVGVMPLSLGTVLLAIIAALPIPAWTKWLQETGIKAQMDAIPGGTTEVLSIFIVVGVAYSMAKNYNVNKVNSIFFSLSVFFCLMPQMVGKTGALAKTYIGSGGIFIGMIVAILVTLLYKWLSDKNLNIKLPDSVPSMVSDALAPVFIAIIIFTLAFFIRLAFFYTPYNNIFELVGKIISGPIVKLGGSIPALIAFQTICNFFWFFGIHPSTIQSAYAPIFLTATTANIEAFQQGHALPYLAFLILNVAFLMLGGTGGTIGLSFDMLFFSKSARYKTLGKLAIIPSIFNINEPLIFGAPVILNPIFFIPMILEAPVMGGIGYLFVKMGWFNNYNPLVAAVPTVPSGLTVFLASGPLALIAVLIATVVSGLLYYPFFKAADKRAVTEENNK